MSYLSPNGRNSFPKSLSRSMELTQLVSLKQDQTYSQTHSREIQHSGRSIIQNKQTDFRRMVSQSKNCQCNFSHDQFPQHSFLFFATRLNHRLPLYVPPIPDEKTLAIDAFTMNWNHIHTYAFPPFHLIPSVWNRICQSQCRIVLVAPLWHNRSWFPRLLNLLVSQPICLGLSRPSGTVTRKISTSKHSTCPSRMGIIKQSIRNKKFSREVAGKTASTRQVCDSR